MKHIKTDQYDNLIDIETYTNYLKEHSDLKGVLQVHMWLAIRYAVYMPYLSSQKQWSFVFSIHEDFKQEAPNMMKDLHNYPQILFGHVEDKVYR